MFNLPDNAPPLQSLPWYRRVPPMTTLLLFFNLAPFIATEVAGGSTDAAVLALCGAKVGGLIEAGQWWRVVTSAFLHIGPIHLLINLYALVLLGAFIERAYGALRMLVIYAGGVVGGGVLSFLLSPHISAGASGAIMGLLGVAMMMAYRNRHRLSPAAQRTFWIWLLPFFALSMLLSFFIPSIDALAHLGGLGGGLGLALLLGERPPAEAAGVGVRTRLSVVVAFAFAAGLLGAALSFGVIHAAGGALWSWDAPRLVEDRALGLRLFVPRGWLEVPRRDVDTLRFTDGVGFELEVEVLPASPKNRPRPGNEDEVLAASPAEAAAVLPKVKVERTRVGDHDVLRARGTLARGLIAMDSVVLPRPGLLLRIRMQSRVSSQHVYAGLADELVRRIQFDATAPLPRAWAALRDGDATTARELLEPSLQGKAGGASVEGPRRAHTLMALAWSLQALGQVEAALARVAEASKAAGRDVPLGVQRAELLHVAGRTQDAQAVLKELRTLAGKDARALQTLSTTATTLKLDAFAIELLEDLTTTHREDYALANNLAWLLATTHEAKLRDPKKAARVARMAVEGTTWSEPSFIDTLAEAELQAGRPAEALRVIDKAIALSPGSKYLQRQRARMQAAAQTPQPPSPAPAAPSPAPPEKTDASDAGSGAASNDGGAR